MKLAVFNECYWLHDASLLDFRYETGTITFRTELYYNLGMPGPLPPPGPNDYATGIVIMSGVRIVAGDLQDFATSLDGEILSLLPLPSSSPFSDRIQLNAMLWLGPGDRPDIFARLDFELEDIVITFRTSQP
ncbi:hypothetical protein [Sinorhizobium arboris]|uniref:hypothetical protein n=1 Tax=Sinorhizobium arboris TaxID=76745 RepID=UPI00048236C2|nr:hypothetical protein [Sinorhizobium arboris]